MRRIGLVALAGALVAGACGGSPSALEQTEANMAKMKSAELDLRYSATSGSGDAETGPVGFHLKGPYSFDDGSDLAVFDVTYTELLGGRSNVTSVRSTGKAAFVEVDGTAYRVGDDAVASLRLSDDASGGFGDLGIAGWVENPKVREGRETDRITGEVDAADLLSDIARIAASLGNDQQLAELDDAAAQRLARLVKSSEIEVVTGATDRRLRSLEAVISFGTRAPNELRRTLGKYASARLEIALTLEQLKRPLRVTAPDDYEQL